MGRPDRDSPSYHKTGPRGRSDRRAGPPCPRPGRDRNAGSNSRLRRPRTRPRNRRDSSAHRLVSQRGPCYRLPARRADVPKAKRGSHGSAGRAPARWRSRPRAFHENGGNHEHVVCEAIFLRDRLDRDGRGHAAGGFGRQTQALADRFPGWGLADHGADRRFPRPDVGHPQPGRAVRAGAAGLRDLPIQGRAQSDPFEGDAQHRGRGGLDRGAGDHPGAHRHSLVQAALRAEGRPGGRDDGQGDRGAVVLDLRVPGSRRSHLRRGHDPRRGYPGGAATPARDR